jgi:hypothetical protein
MFNIILGIGGIIVVGVVLVCFLGLEAEINARKESSKGTRMQDDDGDITYIKMNGK